MKLLLEIEGDNEIMMYLLLSFIFHFDFKPVYCTHFNEFGCVAYKHYFCEKKRRTYSTTYCTL